MKIELLTQDDPLYILPFFEEFFQYYASEFQILQVSSSRAMGKRPRFQLLRELTYLYGPLGMAKVDRKSTRLNSSHLVISYAVFCLKKKKKTPTQIHYIILKKIAKAVKRRKEKNYDKAQIQIPHRRDHMRLFCNPAVSDERTVQQC